jgi:hypothetical protein
VVFDKLGVWSRLELALYIANHGGDNWREQMLADATPPARMAVDEGAELVAR